MRFFSTYYSNRFLRYVLIVLASCIALGSTANAANRQHYAPTPLCDDYIRLKLQEYLDRYETVDYEDYAAYKEEITRFCQDQLANDRPPSYDRDALHSFSRSLD